MLDSNADRDVYGHPSNDGSYQMWRHDSDDEGFAYQRWRFDPA